MAEADLGLLQHPRWSSLWLTASILDAEAVLDPPLIGGAYEIQSSLGRHILIIQEM